MSDVVAAARAWVGTPYRHQASTPGAGCDCLGLIRGVWRMVVGDEPWVVPAYTRDVGGGLEDAARRWLVPGELEAGAVVLFRLHRSEPPRHCGIMVSATRFVHAQEKRGVVEVDLTEAWRRRVAGVFAFPVIERDLAPLPSAATSLRS